MKSRKFSRKWKIGAVATMLASLSLGVVAGCKDKGGETSSVTPPPPAESLGVFYFDTGIEEIQLSLDAGNKFTYIANGESKSGTYTSEGSVVTLKFEGESAATTATLDGNVLTWNYNNEQIRFFKKVYYTVSYEELGGSEMTDTTVVNGKTVAKPADPVREGYEFLGWYADSEYQDPYMFGTQIVTGNVTLYAQWALVKPGAVAYTVDFDLGYEAEEGATPAAMETIGGLLYNAPTPTREGYKFCGWWISAYENGEKLTYKYTPETVFTANTTLFAVWESENLGSKLAAPQAEILGDTIRWDGVQGVSIYRLKVTGPEGFLAIDEDVSATSYVIDFANAPAGDYDVEVTAVAANPANNSETVKRSYINKAVGRVSQFSVLDGKVLLFNRVEDAEVYYITVKCGNSAHNHVMFNNGDSTYYSFANCEMVEGGIQFTVTAAADGYAPVESETFVYNRVLDKVEGITVDEETQMVTWYPVQNATNYIVSVSCGNKSHVHEYVNVGNKTSFSLKECSAVLDGEIKINVYAQTKGYNSPAPTEYSYKKTKLASPSNIVFTNVDGKYMLTWAPVTDVAGGTVSYSVKIGNVIVDATENSLDLTDVITWVDETKYDISVKAEVVTDGQTTNESPWSDAIAVYYKKMTEKLSYKAGVVSWEPVIGAIGYEVKVNNGGIVETKDGASSMAIELTQEGTNTVYVRYLDEKGPSSWTIFEIENAKEIIFDSRGGSEVPAQYKVIGDPIELPTPTREGYDFVGWYNTPNGPESNGALFEDDTFTGNSEMVLYAYWAPATFEIEYAVGADGKLDKQSGSAVYTKHYTLDVPVVEDGTKVFLGWFAGSSTGSEQLTDDRGHSLKPWNLKKGATVYALYISNVLKYTLLEDGTYSVSRGPNASKLTTITIPEKYETIAVTVVDGYAFQNCSKLVSVNIPDTIKIVSEETAFENCRKLQEVNVYETGNSKIPVYSSEDGVLLYKNEITGATELSFFPKAKAGEYVVPDGVTEIPLRLFEGTQVTEVTVSNTVTVIRGGAFINCSTLQKVSFAEGGTDDLIIEDGAFRDCISLTSITLPARLTELQVSEETHTISIFTGCASLTHVNVERGNQTYASNDGVITNKAGTELIFCPTARKGSYTIPQGVEKVGAYAFNGCAFLTEIVVPGYVETVGEYAFAGCSRVTNIKFSGGAVEGMKTEIGDYAFADMTSLRNIEFMEGSVVSSIGAYAFTGTVALRSFVIPTTMEYIGDYAFEKAAALNKVEFANGAQGELEFGNYVFSECISLTEVILPESVVKLNLGVFDGCVNIARIEVNENNQYYKDEDGVVYSKDGKDLVFFPKGRQTETGEYVLSEGVESISEGAFKGMRFITTINIPNTVTHIGKYAFKDSMSLNTLTFASGNEDAKLIIDEEAFAGCAAITSVSLPVRAQKIAAKAFYNVNMTSVEFPAGLEEIGDYAFAHTALTSVEIPATVATFGNYVFDTCIKLTSVTYASGYVGTTIPVGTFRGAAITSINIPASVEKIGYAAFNECVKLETVTFEEGGTASLVIGAMTSENGEAVKDENGITVTGVFMGDTSLKTVALPDRVTYIGDNAFSGCSALATFTINETSTLERIGNSAFQACVKLTQIFIPKTVQNTPYVDENTSQEYAIGERAFANAGLVTVTFGEGGTGDLSLGYSAFENCGEFLGYQEGKYGPEPIVNPMEVLNLPARIAPIYVIIDNVPSIREGISADNLYSTPLREINVADGGKYYGSRDGILYKRAERDGEYVLDSMMMIPARSQAEITVPYTVSYINQRVAQGSSSSAVITTLNFEATPEGETPVDLTIGQGAFSNVKTLTTVNFPNRLKVIETSAFANTSLVDLVLPASLESLNGTYTYNTSEGGQFNGIKTLKTLTFEKGIKIEYIPGQCFKGCTGLTSIEIPASVEKIGQYAFDGCTGVTTLTFEEGSQLQHLTQGAFRNMKITELALPDSFTTLDGGAFGTLSKLTHLTLSKNFTSYTTIINGQPRFAFADLTALQSIDVHPENPYFMAEDGILYTKNQKTGGRGSELIYAPIKKTFTDYTYTTPEGVSSIATFAFKSHPGVRYLTISSDLTHISSYAFQSSSLRTITFEDRESPLIIGDYAFNGCSYLGGVKKTDEDGVTRKVFEIPEEVVFEGASIFLNSFTRYDSGNSEKTIIRFLGDNESKALNNTFYGATRISGVENIPCNLASMDATFQGCTSLASVTFNDDPNGMIITMAGTFKGCTALTSIDLPAVGALTNKNMVTSGIWKPGSTGNLGTFQDCTNLQSITIKDCTTIGVAVFMNCTKLTAIDIPDNVVSIGQGAFYNCTKLQTVDMPANLETLDNYAFMKCSSLQSIELYDFLATIGIGAFEGCSKLANVAMGDGLETIQTRAFYSAATLKDVEFPSTLRTIGNEAFYGCSSLTKIELPASVVEVGEYAFANCTSVETITAESGLTTLGDYAFMNCRLVETFTIPETLINLGIGAFQGWDSLKELKVDGSNLDYAFKDGVLYNATYTKIIYVDASASGDFVIPDTVLSLTEGLFAGTKITSIVLPDTITEIPAKTFQGCSELTSVTLPANLEKIGAMAFEGCTSLKSITIPKSVHSTFDKQFISAEEGRQYGCEPGVYISKDVDGIGHYAFGNCTALENVIFEEGGARRLSFGDFAFYGCTNLKGTLNETTGEYEFVIPSRVRGDGVPTNWFRDIYNPGYGMDSHVNLLQGVGMYAFARCDSLQNVIFEDESSIIFADKLIVLKGAFAECRNLKSVTFAETVGDITMLFPTGKGDMMATIIITSLHEELFNGCDNLTTVTFKGDTSDVSATATAFEGCKVDVSTLPITVVRGSIGEDWGGGKADWQDWHSQFYGIDGCTCSKGKDCTSYNPHKGIFPGI